MKSKRHLLSFFVFFLSLSAFLFADDFTQEREHMVVSQIQARGVTDETVLKAMRSVKRHEFVPPQLEMFAYADQPLPIGEEQTISQPYIVALMTELLKPGSNNRVLEIGTGSGYQAAVLAEIVKEVYTIEIIPVLGKRAEAKLRQLGYENIHVKIGDGYLGWPEEAPFDAIIVTAAPEDIPQPLIDQLRTGGRMVIPVGNSPSQTLYLMTKTETGLEKKEIIPVRFVPMVGQSPNSVDPVRN